MPTEAEIEAAYDVLSDSLTGHWEAYTVLSGDGFKRLVADALTAAEQVRRTAALDYLAAEGQEWEWRAEISADSEEKA